MAALFIGKYPRFVKALTPLAITLLAMVCSLAVYDYYLSKKNAVQQLESLVAVTLQADLDGQLQRDHAALSNRLQILVDQPGVTKACLYQEDKQSLVAAPQKAMCPSLFKAEPAQAFSIQVQQYVTVNGSDRYLLVLGATFQPPQWHWLLLLALAAMTVAGFIWWLNQRYHRQLSLPPITLNDNKYKPQEGVQNENIHSVGDEELERLIAVFNQLPDITRDKKQQMQELVIKLKDKFLQLEFKAASFEEKDKAIRQMFAGASHDLRQPLQAISLFAESLSQSASAEQQKTVENLSLSIASLNTMFTDLLDLSKLESRIENVRFAPVYLRPLLEKVHKEFLVVANNKGLQLRLQLSDLVVESNDTMLERMVRNLISNAIRYTESGGVLLSCRLKKGMVSIEVWDTGPGIAAEKMSTIFEQFVQLDNDQPEARQGLGLGLSIIKRLNDLMGHQLSVDSRVGRGTVFRIAAPVYIQRKRRVTSPPIVNVDLDLPPTDFQQALTVILIDDDHVIRAAITELLISWGMEVIAFESVTAIWEYYSEHSASSVDLIISDFQLSRTETAFDAIAILRVNLVEQVPVLIITGAQEEMILQEIKESGYPMLKKPVKPAKLRAMMQYIVSDKKSVADGIV